jgi:hypothetical protein
MSLRDRVHGSPPRTAADGGVDGRSERRTGRIFQIPFRGTLVVKEMLRAIRRRDNIPSDPVLLELMIQAYLEKYGHPPIVIPSEDELVKRYERERDRRDGE